MKKILPLLIFSLVSFSIYGQSTAGQIAHWDFNGSANDVSGNGHNGHLNNVVPAVGISGLPNSAYYFNGVNSYITVPYSPSLNLSVFSICAKLKVEGFWSGDCQANMIVQRGNATAHTSGSYSLTFDDNSHDSDCHVFDSTQETFYSGAAMVPHSYAASYYTPTIQEDTWYAVVITFNDTEFKTYVNGILKYTAPVTAPGLVGSSTDSISIGCNIYGVIAGFYQWYYKGLIDDIIIYNRVLSDTEVGVYSADCGTITTQPSSDTVLLGNNAEFSVATNMPSPTYQWQENTSSGYVNLVNVPPYSGVSTDTLTILSATMILNNTNYRCVISNSSCADTTNTVLLTVHDNSGVNTPDLKDLVSIFPNPATKQVSIHIPFTYSHGQATLFNELGQSLLESNLTLSSTLFDIDQLPTGIYIMKIVVDGRNCYKQIIKN